MWKKFVVTKIITDDSTIFYSKVKSVIELKTESDFEQLVDDKICWKSIFVEDLLEELNDKGYTEVPYDSEYKVIFVITKI